MTGILNQQSGISGGGLLARLKAKERQALAPNQPPAKMKTLTPFQKAMGVTSSSRNPVGLGAVTEPSPFRRALQRVSPYNEAVPNTSGLVSSPTRRGVVGSPTSAPGLNDATDASRLADKLRQVGSRHRTTMNYAARKSGPQGSLAEAMFGDRYATGFTGSVGQRDDGTTGMMSSHAKARQKMSPLQLALSDASAERRTQRKDEAKSLRQQRNADRRNLGLQRQSAMRSPLLGMLMGLEPQAAAELAVDMRGQDLRAQSDQAVQAVRASDVASEVSLRDLEWLSELLDLRTKMRLHGD